MTFQKESNRSNFNEVIENDICRYLDLVKKRYRTRNPVYREHEYLQKLHWNPLHSLVGERKR